MLKKLSTESGGEQQFHNGSHEFTDSISYKVCLKNAITYRDHFQPGLAGPTNPSIKLNGCFRVVAALTIFF